jgi:hypothetical protein
VPAEPVAVVFPTDALVPPDQPWPWPDPESTARGFLELIGVTDPALGSFEATGPGEGQIALYLRAEDGTVRTTVERSVLRMALVDGHWAVLDATSPSISLELVAVGGESLTVSGRGRGFEGTLHVRLIGHGDVDFRREAVVTASGGEELLPFSTTLDLSGSSGQRATVIVTSDSGLDGGPVDVSARAIQLP